MTERSKKQPPEAKVSWISLNFGILILVGLIALVGWAAWYLPRDRSSEITYQVDPTAPANPPRQNAESSTAPSRDSK